MGLIISINPPKYAPASIERFDDDGRLHCVDGPALVGPDREIWAIHGRLHRLDGPAWIDRVVKIEQWSVDGDIHRGDGPARILFPGHPGSWGKPQDVLIQEWWRRGKRYRDDGPAVIYSTGYRQWYLDHQVSEIEFLVLTKAMSRDHAERLLMQELGKRDRKLLLRFLNEALVPSRKLEDHEAW